MCIVIIVQCQPNLLEIILARRTPGGLSCLLNGRQQQSDQDCDNRNDDQLLDESKSASNGSHGLLLTIAVWEGGYDFTTVVKA